MSDDSSFQDRVRRWSDGATLSLLSKAAAVVLLPLGSVIGGAVWVKLDKTSESTARLEEQVKALISSTLPQLNVQLDGRFNSLSDRVTEHSRRLDRLEDWRNTRTIQ